jgi:hypothetical protein
MSGLLRIVSAPFRIVGRLLLQIGQLIGGRRR